MTRPQAMQAAREMWEGGEGWTVTEIRRYLAERGHRVTLTTIRCWADPEYAHRRNERRLPLQRRADRARRGSRAFRVLDDDARARLLAMLAADPPRPRPEATPEWLMMLRVEDGLTYNAISKVTRRFLGLELTEDQVRHRLDKLGAPKNQNKSRATSMVHARRRSAA